MKNLILKYSLFSILLLITSFNSFAQNRLYNICTELLDWKPTSYSTIAEPRYHMSDFIEILPGDWKFLNIHYYITQLNVDDGIGFSFVVWDDEKKDYFTSYDVIELTLENHTTLILNNRRSDPDNGYLFVFFASELLDNAQIVEVLKNYRVTKFTLKRGNRILFSKTVPEENARLFNFHCQCVYFFRNNLNFK